MSETAAVASCPRCGDPRGERYEHDGQRLCFPCHQALAGAPLVAEAPSVASAASAGPTLAFVSAAELKRSTAPEPDWLWTGYIFAGGLTLLPARPKAGKSTLTGGLLCAMAAGDRTFLGRPIVAGPTVFVSEEAAGTLVHKLPSSDRIRVLTRDAAFPKPAWPDLVLAAVAEAERVGARLLVIDTLPYWAGMAAEREKDAGAALAVMSACIEAARRGLGVLLPAHARKGGGEDGESVRGSSAFAGAVDVIVELERVPDAPRQRALLTLSRFPQTPGTLVAELDRDGTWCAVLEDDDRVDSRALGARQRELADRAALLDALDGGDALTRAELEDATGTPARQWYKVLEGLVKDGRVGKSGAGKRGDPQRFRILRTDSAQRAPESGAETGSAEVLDFLRIPVGNAESAPSNGSDSVSAHDAETNSNDDAYWQSVFDAGPPQEVEA